MQKTYYKDIDLTKRDCSFIDGKIKYIPLNIYITKNDALVMLENMHQFYKDRVLDLKNLLNLAPKNKEWLNDLTNFKSKISDILRLKSWLKTNTYKNHIIKFDKKYNKRPKKSDYYTEILYHLSIDGYLPHIDTLEII